MARTISKWPVEGWINMQHFFQVSSEHIEEVNLELI